MNPRTCKITKGMNIIPQREPSPYGKCGRSYYGARKRRPKNMRGCKAGRTSTAKK